jgi:LuxR family maltose regulon positive regulatory protein
MEKKISDPRLVLKATAPKASRSLIYRSRLGLHQGRQADSPVICVQAAAGYGKSSLLLQWRREALESGALVAWLTLDEHDDGTSFIGGLNAALSIGSGTGRFVYEPPGSGISSEDEIEALTVWLAEVAAMAIEVVLILDDVHTLPPATASDSLLYLLLNAPANLKVILAYRRPIVANFFDLMASGRLLELRAADLSLSLEETIEVLEGRLGNAIDRDACVRLYELTEGWPFGVQLAVSSILKGARPQEAIAEFSARSSDLQHYFIESLVERLPQEAATFLTHICCLARVHPDLCQAVTENPNSASLLEFLRDETPLFRDETGADWMRIHPIARDTLASQCETVPAEQRQAMHTRAAQWLADACMKSWCRAGCRGSWTGCSGCRRKRSSVARKSASPSVGPWPRVTAMRRPPHWWSPFSMTRKPVLNCVVRRQCCAERLNFSPMIWVARGTTSRPGRRRSQTSPCSSASSGPTSPRHSNCSMANRRTPTTR